MSGKIFKTIPNPTSTAATAATRPPSAKCKTIVAALSGATWIRRNDPKPDLASVTDVIEKLNNHISSECQCSSLFGVNLILASCYVEQFLGLFWTTVEHMKSSPEEIAKQTPKGRQAINDVEVQDHSRFVLFDASKLTDCNFCHLVQPAILALECYQQVIYWPQLKATQVEEYKILSKLHTLFEVFLIYNLHRQALITSQLATHVLTSFYKKRSFLNDDHLLALCNSLRIHLRLGCYRRAKLLYRQYTSELRVASVWKDVPVELTRPSLITTFAHSLLFLLHIEIGLLARNAKEVSTELKNFINCDYLASNTLKRFLLKAMAYATAAKFPSAVYDYRKTLNELIEPFHMLMLLGQRWGMFMVQPSQKQDQRYDDSDVPVKFRLMVLSVMGEMAQGHLDFFVNTGLLHEASFYFKAAQSLHISTLNIVGLAQIQLSSIEYDLNTGMSRECEAKLASVEALFQQHSTRVHKSIFKPCSRANREVVDGDSDDMVTNTDPVMSLSTFQQPLVDDIARQEQISLNRTAREAYRELLLLNRPKRFKIKDKSVETSESTAVIMMGQNLLKNFAEDFTSLRLPFELFPHLYALYMRILMIKTRIAYQNDPTMFTPDIALSKYRSMFCYIEEFITKVYLPEVETCNNHFKTDGKSTISEQLFCGPFSTMHWSISHFYIKVLIDVKSYTKALSILEQVTSESAYTVSTRFIRATLFFYKALCLYKLYKQQSAGKDKMNPFFKVNKTKLEETVNSISIAVNVTPKALRIKTTALNTIQAPVKVNYVDSAVHEYAQSLLTVADGDIKAEGTRNVLQFNDEDVKTPLRNSSRIKSALKPITPNNVVKSITGKKSKKRAVVVEDLATALSDLDLEETPSTYCSRWFTSSEDISTVTYDHLKAPLGKVIAYVGLHPPIALYSSYHRLCYKISKIEKKSSSRIGYHLAENAYDLSLRYRYVLNHQRQVSRKIVEEGGGVFDLDFIRFCTTDYSFDPTKNYLDQLEPNWRFVQIRTAQNGCKVPDLVLCRYEKGRKPVFLRVKSDLDKDLDFFMTEFADVMRLNMSSIRETKKEIFWKVRNEENVKLNKLLETVERKWFGCFKGFFLGKIVDKKFEKAMHTMLAYLNNETKFKDKPTDWQLLEVFLESIPLLTDGEIDAGFQLLYPGKAKSVKEQILKLRLACFKNVDKIDVLMQHIKPVGLVLDPVFAQFPFESMPTFRQHNHPFFRVPSLRFAVALCNAHREVITQGVDCNDTFYLLNASNNLPATQERFDEAFKSIPGWRGVMKRDPTEKELLDMIQRAFYVYFGHGSGTLHYRNLQHMFELNSFKPASFVVGCSSGRLVCEGPNTEITGSAYRFMLAGAPTYIGNLWDVTDKDIDQFADAFLTLATMPIWKAQLESTSKARVDGGTFQDFARSLAMSRRVCKLPHLIGAAPVVYGLPLGRKI